MPDTSTETKKPNKILFWVIKNWIFLILLIWGIIAIFQTNGMDPDTVYQQIVQYLNGVQAAILIVGAFISKILINILWKDEKYNP
jgi:H+/gluconate symporter-like permease